MIVNFKKKFSVIHIPKTGGTSIKKSLIQENIEKDIYFFHKKLHVYPEFLERSKEIKTKLKFSHLTFEELNKFYPSLFRKLIEFDFYVTIRKPSERFISSLIQYFGEEKINLSNITENQMMIYLNKILSNIEKNNFQELPSLASFKKQYDFIYFKNQKIVQNIYKINEIDKMFYDINKKYGMYFNNLKKENISGHIRYNPFKSNLLTKSLPNFLKQKILDSYNFFLPKEYKYFNLKYKNVLNNKIIHDFIKSYYEKDIKIFNEL